MDQTATEEEEECGICLDALTNPVALPCRHKFCSECLNSWRSKYGWRILEKDREDDRKCPLCREKIPPSKEMEAQLKTFRLLKSNMEATGDTFSENYVFVKSSLEKLEREIGDATEMIDYSGDDRVALPMDICKAASTNHIQKVLNWLGPPPVDKQRVNAKNPEVLDATLVHCAAVHGQNSDSLSILLQLGADVDPVDAAGATPLRECGRKPEPIAVARLLLEWGAEISNCSIVVSKDKFIEYATDHGNSELANLLESEFGGRRCEIINLSNHPALIGKTCVVEKYLPEKGRYKVVFEMSKEVGLVGPDNLKRCDRTPDDCGYYITYENGRSSRHDFALREECQAFVASLTQGDKSGDGDGDAEAVARADEAAESLLAELSIESSAVDRKSKKGKKKGRKK